VLCFFWLSWIDRILDPKHTIDGDVGNRRPGPSLTNVGRITAI
jgi:hypothetical protein